MVEKTVFFYYLDLYIGDTALKVSRSLYCFTTSIYHYIENYFPGLWGMGIYAFFFLFTVCIPATVVCNMLIHVYI